LISRISGSTEPTLNAVVPIVAAIAALALMGDEASRAIPALMKLTESKNEVLRELAKQAVENIKNGAKPKKAAPKKAAP
jgi:hypothetical protein